MADDPKVQLDYEPFPDVPEGTRLVGEVERELGQLVGGEWAGWHRGHLGGLDVAVFARYSESDSGRQVLSGLLLLGDNIRGETLRKVPITVMENARNLTESYSSGTLKEALDKLPPLRREPGMTAEQFSKLVAEHYKAWANEVPSPAAAIAAEWGLKPPTVHSWIREARLRGFLPPARRGRQK
jgi:hypothetical protein